LNDRELWLYLWGSGLIKPPKVITHKSDADD